jgi:SAM-dependent methyltransferase
MKDAQRPWSIVIPKTTMAHEPARLSCPICGTRSPLERRVPEAELFRCPECAHCFTDINSLVGLETYGAEYFEITHKRWFEHPNYPLFRRIVSYLSTLPPRGAVIDVGCGRGDFLRFLDHAGLDLRLIGVDFAAPAPEPGIQFIRGDVLQVSIGRSFDAVVSLAVIEHVPDVHRFVERLRELCAPGGLIVIMTNHEGGLLYRLARLLHRLGFRRPCERLYSKHHLNHFNVTSLTRLLRGHGLVVEDIRYHNTPIAAVDIPASSVAGEMVLRALVWVIWVLGRLTRQTFLQVIVCRRPLDTPDTPG